LYSFAPTVGTIDEPVLAAADVSEPVVLLMLLAVVRNSTAFYMAIIYLLKM
jgi:hypothetical protein